MEIHHDKHHHQGYVGDANAGLDMLEQMRENNHRDIKGIKRNLVFNLSRHAQKISELRLA